MGFVDGKEGRGRADAAELRRRAHETLGREVKQPKGALRDSAQRVMTLIGSERAVERGSRNAAGVSRRHLILHEGDERRHDDGKTAQSQRGNLKADRLPRSGRQHGEDVAPGEN